ncbi:hypothetical protein [Mycoplasmopsis pulmonis]|uniref:hypothetical protein n=1 Tax=Mycoplasmopsis pulmonis TaxID=2107 RepID=UPI002ACD7749|nr:hypothetical protein [Mycoplasmopsis pulmonis]MDZ7293307.1 hypothetical protein [Mycoplasmopsis pulmonis]
MWWSNFFKKKTKIFDGNFGDSNFKFNVLNPLKIQSLFYEGQKLINSITFYPCKVPVLKSLFSKSIVEVNQEDALIFPEVFKFIYEKKSKKTFLFANGNFKNSQSIEVRQNYVFEKEKNLFSISARINSNLKSYYGIGLEIDLNNFKEIKIFDKNHSEINANLKESKEQNKEIDDYLIIYFESFKIKIKSSWVYLKLNENILNLELAQKFNKNIMQRSWIIDGNNKNFNVISFEFSKI